MGVGWGGGSQECQKEKRREQTSTSMGNALVSEDFFVVESLLTSQHEGMAL